MKKVKSFFEGLFVHFVLPICAGLLLVGVILGLRYCNDKRIEDEYGSVISSAYDHGYDVGLEEGMFDGYSYWKEGKDYDGYHVVYDKGWWEGVKHGYSQGYSDGYADASSGDPYDPDG